jgi:peptide/nickel transport system permease protein
MTTFLLRRIALIVPTLFFVSVLIFGLQQLLPGDPALALAGENQDPAVIAYLHQKYHLDRPIPVRYALWVQGLLQGDLGESIRIKRPVLDLIREKLPVTAELASLALVIALAIGVPAGIIAAVKHDTAVDYGATMASACGAPRSPRHSRRPAPEPRPTRRFVSSAGASSKLRACAFEKKVEPSSR